MKIFLIGYMASGKSVVGERLAQLLDYQFVDTDKWIEARCCKTVADLFYEEGEDFFREKEKECLEFLIDQENVVVATGGGTPCFNDTMSLMNEMGATVYLAASVNTLCDRVWNEKAGRPMLTNCHNKEELHEFVAEHLSQREEKYKQCMHSFEVDLKMIDTIAQEIKSSFDD